MSCRNRVPWECQGRYTARRSTSVPNRESRASAGVRRLTCSDKTFHGSPANGARHGRARMDLSVYCDNTQEGVWFRDLVPALGTSPLHKLRNREGNPAMV